MKRTVALVSLVLLLALGRSLRADEANEWHFSVVTHEDGRSPSAVVDPNRWTHVSYTVDLNNSERTIHYALNAPSQYPDEWFHLPIDETFGMRFGPSSAIAVTDEKVFVCYQTRGNQYRSDDPNTPQDEYDVFADNRLGLWVRDRTDGTTSHMIVDEGGPEDGPGADLDPNEWAGDHPIVGDQCHLMRGPGDEIHASYSDETNKDIKYAKFTLGSGVGGREVVAGGNSDVGPWNALGLFGETVHFGYYEETSLPNVPSKRIRYTKKTAGGYAEPETIDADVATGGVGKWNSMAVDKNGKVHLCYFDDSSTPDVPFRFKYATNASGAWVSESIADSSPNNGPFCSVAICGDRLHMSYAEVPLAGGLPGPARLLYRSKKIGEAWGAPELLMAGTAQGYPLDNAIACNDAGWLFVVFSHTNLPGAGSAMVAAEKKAPICGDGFLDSGETCDDGNRDSGDGCSEGCQKEATVAGGGGGGGAVEGGGGGIGRISVDPLKRGGIKPTSIPPKQVSGLPACPPTAEGKAASSPCVQPTGAGLPAGKLPTPEVPTGAWPVGQALPGGTHPVAPFFRATPEPPGGCSLL